MGYVEKVLSPGEEILARASISWFSQMKYVLAYAVVSIVFIYGFAVLSLIVHDKMYLIGFIVAPAIMLGTLLQCYLRIYTTEIAITNQRLIVKMGLIRRDTIEIPVSRIESIELNQSLMGRLLKYGSLSINGTGGIQSPLNFIKRPLEFKQAVDMRRH